MPTKAFYSCAALEKAVIGNNVTTIGNNAFAACSKLAEVTFGRSVKTIGDSAFYNCSVLAAVNLPDSVETIGSSAFNGCSAMATLNLSNSLKTIGGWAFYNCTSLTALTTPASLEKIDGEAFYRCTGLKTIELYGNDLLLNSWSFENISAAETIIIHEGVKTINGNVFSNAKELKTVTFPKSIDTIDENAIKGYTAITAFCHEDSPAHTYLKKLNNVTICFIADNFFIVDPTIDKLSSGSVTLKWKKPNGYDNIDHYIIYKDGVKYDEATQTSYTDDDISAGNTYTYEISAVDNSGLVSERKAIDVTPACSAVTALNLPGGKTAIGGTKPVALSATMENGLARDGAKGEFIYSSDGEGWLIACSAIADSDGVNYTGSWDLKDIASGNYTLRFRFTDKNGAVTFKDAAVSVDRTAPAKIDSVGIVPQETKISLNWIISTEHDTERYRIYRAAGDGDFELISEIQKREILHYDDVKVAKNTVYRYYIVGVDPFNQESETYDVVSACLTGDTMAPSIKRIQPNSGATIAGKKTFTVTASDNVGVTRTELYCSSDPEAPLESWKLVCEKNGSAFSEPVDTANMPYGIVYIVAKVYDAAGNVGISDSYRYMCDNKGPDKVAHVKLEENLGTKIVLSWLRPEEDDTAYFIVEVKQPNGSFKQIGEKQSRYLYQTITGLIPETEYTMQVVPYDQNGNRGTPSDPIVLTTSGDMICPKVTKATATSNTYGYASERIDFSVYASDDYQLAKIEIQSSFDKKKWTTIKAFAPEHNNREQSFSYTYNVSGMNEGELYIRMVAEDTAGNSSLENVTEILTYHIDRTNTAVPENVSASSDKEYIAVSWNEPDDNTVVGFNLMRCDSKDGNYKEIRTNTNAVLIYDEDVVPGKTYWYKVQSVDKAGNLSAFSAPVSCTVTPDTSAPRINGFTPAVNSKLSPSYPTVNIEVIDNSMLTNLKVEYKVNGLLSFYTVLKEIKDNTSKKCNVDVKLPIEDLNNDDSVTLLINATDGAGNTMEPKELTYTIDKEAPELKNVKVSHTDKKNTVTWESSSTDTNKFYVMRKTSEDGEFIAISAIDHDNGKTSYSFTDNDLSDDTYFKYRVVAYDDVRNHRESDTDEVIVEHPSWVYTHLDFSEYQIEGKEYSYDMSGTETATSITEYNYDFGDGCVITTTDEYVWHMYDYAGTYDVRVTAKDEDGNTCTSEGTVYVQAPSLSGHVTVCVQDENGRSVSGAEVYLDGVISCYYPTNSAGCAEFDLPLGIHTFVAFKDHYSPMSAQTVSVDGGDQIVYVPIRNKELVTCEFNVKKMSFEEIKKAGIDLDDENNYREGMLKFDMKFVSEGEPTEATYYYGGGKLYGKPVYVYVGKNTPTPEKRVITPMIIGVGDEENPLLAFLDVPDMPYKAVKDFFDVNLTVYNNASRDYYLAGSQVTLNPSRGLSIVTDSTDSKVSKSRTVSLGTIPGGGSASARWILRGDEAGVYGLSADFTGTLSYFNRPISAHFTYDGKITVSKTPLAAELQISKTANSKGEIFFNLVIENTGSSSIELPYGAMNFAESFSDELISSSGVSCEIAKRGTNVLGAGCKLVYHFRSKQSVLDEFRKSLMQTFSMADVGFKVTYFDDGVFRDRYEKKYPKEAFVFKVINSEGKPLKGAKIDIGTTNFTTDSNGQVTIRGSETEEIEAKFLKVTCPGYVIHRDENFVGALYGPGKTITLYKEDDFDISSVDMNGVDVLCNRTDLYVDETLSDDSPARVSFIVQLKGQQASSIKFTQNGNKEIAPIKTNYDKSNNRYTFITYVSYIKECTPITIEAVSPVGKLLIKTLKVSPIHGRYGFGVHMPGLPGIDMDKAGLEWLSGINLGFPISGSSSFSYAYDRNKDIHAVTLSTTSPFNIWEKSTTAATETAFGTITETVTETTTIPGFSDMMEMFKKNIENAKNGKDLNSINHISKGGMDYGAAVYYKIVGEKIEVVEAKIFVVFYAEYKYQTVISPVVLPVPLTLCLGFSGSIQGDLGAKFDDNDLHKITPYGSVSGSVSITPSIAVGIPMLNVGLYGMLTLSAMGILDTSVAEAYWDYVKLSGEFGITYEVGVFSGTFPIVSGDIATLYEHKASGDVGAMFDISGYTINNKLLEYNSVWSKPAVLDNGTSTLIDNVDNAEKPQLVKVGDKTVMVYRAVDKEVTSAANSLALYYSIYDPAKLSWSKPVKLDQNHCSDINFKLSSNGVSAQVIYSQVNGELGDDVTLNDFFKKTDIYSASFDPETNRFDAPVKVSDNNIGDANPIVKYIGNTPTAVWVENSNNNIFLNDNSNKLMMSRCINGVWTKPVNIGSGIANLLDFDIVENGKTESVVYITDTDGNMNTTHDRPLTIYNFVSDEQQTVCEDAGAGFTTCIFRNRSSVLWQKNGVMMCYDVASGRSIQLCGRFFAAATDVQMLDNDGEYQLVYVDGSKSVCMITYNSVTNSWSNPVTLAESSNFIQNMTAAYIDGKLSLTYHETQVLDKDYNTQSALIQTVIDSKPNLTINKIKADYDTVREGKETTVYVNVTNNGIQPTGDLTFTVNNYDGKMLGKINVKDSALGVGETKSVPVRFTAPDNIFDCDLHITVSDEPYYNPDGTVGASISELTRVASGVTDSHSFNLGCSDVQVRATEYIDGAKPYIRAVVSNNTDYETPVRLEVYNYSTDEVYYTRNIPSVSSERSLTFDIPLEESYADENGYIAVRVIPTANDADDDNNFDLFAYFDPAMVVGDANLDGKLTIDDVTMIQKHLAGYKQLQGKALKNCDTNKDGKVDISDATRIQLYLSQFTNVNMGYCGMSF
ncbi:MAG: leucine-rich repeat protein [Ruminococcus sp.]|nr:leucine-rich repeat protein [Ruminococcus sp.]